MYFGENWIECTEHRYFTLLDDGVGLMGFRYSKDDGVNWITVKHPKPLP